MTLFPIPLKHFLLCTLALSMAQALYSQQDSVRNDTEWSPPFFIDLEIEKIDSEENLDLMEELVIQEGREVEYQSAESRCGFKYFANV